MKKVHTDLTMLMLVFEYNTLLYINVIYAACFNFRYRVMVCNKMSMSTRLLITENYFLCSPMVIVVLRMIINFMIIV